MMTDRGLKKNQESSARLQQVNPEASGAVHDAPEIVAIGEQRRTQEQNAIFTQLAAPKNEFSARDVLMRLLHEDGGGKSSAPPRYAQQLALLCDAGHSLAGWAAKYLAIKVCGRSPNTVDAKARDLATFIKWFVQTHGRADIDRWIERDTRRYLQHLSDLGRKPATINRALCTLKHFAGWAHGQSGGIFMQYGEPAKEVDLLAMDHPDCKKLSHEEIEALFRVARGAVIRRPGRGPMGLYRPRRNLAILALLYYTGARISEALSLKRLQYDGTRLFGVKCKGHRVREFEVHPDCAQMLNDYLSLERPWDSGDSGDAKDLSTNAARPLFLNRKGGAIGRRSVAQIFEDFAKAAGEGMEATIGDRQGTAERLHLHPHRLRHTFGALYRDASGSDSETAAALGHTSLRHVGRYVRKTQDERRAVLRKVFPPLGGGEAKGDDL